MDLKHKWHSKAQGEFEETLAYVLREFGEKSAEKVYVEVESV